MKRGSVRLVGGWLIVVAILIGCRSGPDLTPRHRAWEEEEQQRSARGPLLGRPAPRQPAQAPRTTNDSGLPPNEVQRPASPWGLLRTTGEQASDLCARNQGKVVGELEGWRDCTVGSETPFAFRLQAGRVDAVFIVDRRSSVDSYRSQIEKAAASAGEAYTTDDGQPGWKWLSAEAEIRIAQMGVGGGVRVALTSRRTSTRPTATATQQLWQWTPQPLNVSTSITST
jgi:hypothetical protein